VPDAVAEVVQKLVEAFSWSGPIGCTFPGVVANGVTRTAANLDPAWIGLDARALLCKAAGQDIRLINDADAAGVAEMTFGAGKGQPGTVFMVTFGTGIGSALFVDGVLVPNTEFGHIEIRGKDAEERASERAKVAHDMSWKHWAKNVNEYLDHIEAMLSPQLVIVGGGISKQSEKFLPLMTGLHARVVPAAMLNDAGITGAAMAAHPGSAAPVRAGAGATANPSLAGVPETAAARGGSGTSGDQGLPGFPDPGLPPG
jgi:polyphosphate glucokinase